MQLHYRHSSKSIKCSCKSKEFCLCGGTDDFDFAQSFACFELCSCFYESKVVNKGNMTLLLFRSRPSVPDFLYRPPCQQQLLLLQKQLHAATRGLLLAQLAALVKEASRRWAREFLGRLRALAAASAAAAQLRATQVSRGVLLLQQWMRLRSRQEEAWAVQGLRLHALLRQQQQQAAAFVATMASGHLQLATQRLQVAHQQLKYALQRPVEKRLHAAFTKLRLLSTLTAAEQQTQKGRAVRLCCTIQRLQHRLLGEAFSKMRGARLMRQQQQDALQQLMQQMRLRRLRWSWQRLMWNMLVQRQACVAGSQRALFLVFICIKARMRSVLRLLQRNAAAANMEEKLRICSNIQQVSNCLI